MTDEEKPALSTLERFARTYLAQRDQIAKQIDEATKLGRISLADKLTTKLAAHDKYIADNRLERFRK